MDLKEEKKLVERAQKDPQVFGELYEQSYQKIYNYILHRVGDTAAAQDLTSETFIKALEKLGSYRWQNVPFIAWLYRIAANQVNNYFRSGKNRPASLDAMFEEQKFEPSADGDANTELIETEEVMERHGEFVEVRNLMIKIPAKYQEVIALRFFEKKKPIEIAAILNKKEGTIRALLSRGLDKLEELYLAKNTQSQKK